MGLSDWWNKGYTPTERSMSLWDLIKDDASQITKESKSQIGKGITGWRPAKAFTPKMLKTGPTPLVRYALPRLGLLSLLSPSDSIVSHEEEMYMLGLNPDGSPMTEEDMLNYQQFKEE
jgi:hypothetical protein